MNTRILGERGCINASKYTVERQVWPIRDVLSQSDNKIKLEFNEEFTHTHIYIELEFKGNNSLRSSCDTSQKM